MKKSVLIILFFVFCSNYNILRGEIITEGKCGTNLHWEFREGNLYYDTRNTLIITGTGEMDSWSDVKARPWHGCADRHGIEEVVLPEGLTTIGDNAFNGFRTISTTIPYLRLLK